MLKNLIKLIVSALAPAAYDELKRKYPDYPLTKEVFVLQLLWVVEHVVPNNAAIADFQNFVEEYINAT
jgi:hypothetical protein